MAQISASAIKAGEAYVLIGASTEELKAGVEDAKKETDKLGKFMDKQGKSLTSSFMRMTGAITAMRVSVGSLSGAFEGIKASKAFDLAQQEGDLNGMISAMQRADAASRRWIEAIPLLGGELSRLMQTFADNSIVEFARRLDVVRGKVKGLSGDIFELIKAQIKRAKIEGAPAAEIAKMEAELGGLERAEEAGKRWLAEQEAGKLIEDIDKKILETQAKMARRFGVVEPEDIEEVGVIAYGLRRLINQLKTLQEERQEARVTYQEMRKARIRGEAKGVVEAAIGEAETAKAAAEPGKTTFETLLASAFGGVLPGGAVGGAPFAGAPALAGVTPGMAPALAAVPATAALQEIANTILGEISRGVARFTGGRLS